MKNKLYMVHVDCGSNPTVRHKSYKKAEKEAKRLAEELGKPTYVLEVIEEVVSKDISKTVTSIDEAVEYLSKQGVSPASITLKHSKAMSAMYSLIVIAEAWNKADDFVPDFDDCSQPKFYPWFSKKDDGLICLNASCVISHMDSGISYRLCFKTSKRARQFGEQFIDLWNDFLLFR